MTDAGKQAAQGVALGASERACYDYPRVDQVAVRDAFVAGAEWLAASVKDAEVNKSLPTQGGGAGDRETVEAAAARVRRFVEAEILASVYPEAENYWAPFMADLRAILSALQAAPSEPDTDNVSLLADLDAGKPCGREAAAVIRQLQADRKAAPSEGGEPVAWRYLPRGNPADAWVLSDTKPGDRGLWQAVEPLFARPPAPSEEPLVGCVVVPREPTEAMLVAARKASQARYGKATADFLVTEAYRAMLAAAPAPDAIRGGE